MPAEAQPQSYRFADTLKRLLRRNAGPAIRKILRRTHPVDLAHVMGRFLIQEQLKLLPNVGDDERQAEVVASMAMTDVEALLHEMPTERAVAVLSAMSADDRTDIMGAVDEELAGRLLSAMPDAESHEVAELLRYDEATAGGIMSPEFIAIPQDTTAAEAIAMVQDSADVEMAFYLYVVNEHGVLSGVLSLRQLVISRPAKAISEVMDPHVLSVRTDEDQEEVARIVSRYDLLAVPVVDDTNKLVGVVTVDDVLDVVREEATEDILKMAGAGEQFEDRPTVLGSLWRRAPWLAVAWVGGIAASFVIGRFEGTLQKYVVLAAFIPIIVGMAGNVGTQTLAVVVRGLATRRIDVKQFWKVVGREMAVGVLLGLAFGAALGGMGFVEVRSEPGVNALMMAGVIGAAAAISMVIAATMGSVMPLILARLRVDPAVATGPFVTTAIDVVGVAVYFNIVVFFL
jgi:magnesium transporter